MADYVARQIYTLDDQVSAGANAAADALTKMATAADATDTVITRVGKSASTLANQYDPATQAANRLAAAQNALSTAQVTLAAGVAKGTITQTAANGVLDTLGAKVLLAKGAVDALSTSSTAQVGAATAMAQAHGTAANAANTAASAHAGFYREIVILGHEVLTGNFSRIPGSVAVLAERSGNLNSIVSTLGGLLFGLPGATLAVVGAFGVMAYESETTERALNNLQVRLSATRDDYLTFAATVNQAAKGAAAQTPSLDSADALTAATTIGGSANFTGDKAALQSLVELADEVARAFGETVPQAADQLALALNDPAAAAKKLESDGLRTMNESLVLTITNLQNSGNMAQASALLLEAYQKAVGDSTQKMTPLQTALHDLGLAFTGTGADGQSLGKVLGDFTTGVLADVIEGLASVVSGIKAIKEAAANVIPGALIDSNTGQAVGGSPVRSAAQNQLYQIAEANGYTPELADFGSRVMHRESSDGTNPAAGNNVMQLQAGTAGDLHVDQNTVGGSITGGLAYLNQLLTKYHGDQVLAAMAYNWGEGNVDAMLAGTKQAPQAATDYAKAVAGSGNYTVVGTGDTAASATSAAPYGANQPLVNQALTKALSVGGTTTTLTDLQNTLDLLTKAQALVPQNTATFNTLQAAIDKTRGAIANTNDPIQAMIKGLNNQVAPLQAADGATRTLADAQQKLTEAAQAAGRDPSAAETATVMADTLATLSAAYKTVLDQTDRQIADQQSLAQAYQFGASSVVNATNYQKAYEEARKDFVAGSPAFEQAVTTLAQKYDQLSAAQADVNTDKAILGQNDELTTIQTEIGLIGATTDARNRELAVLKERQTLISQGADLESEASREAIANAGAIADATTQLQAQQTALDDLSSAATQAFDQVGQALTNAFAQGTVVNWGNVAKTVIASVLQEVLKLAVLNPILNATVGGSRTTLTDAVAAAGGAAGSVTGTTGTAGGITGNLGTYGNILSLGKSAYGAYQSFATGSFNTGIGPLDTALNAPVFYTGLSSEAAAQAAPDALAAGAYGPTLDAAGAATTGALSVGSLLGGVGLGFGAGTLLNTLVGGKQVGGEVGSGVGAVGGTVAGAAIGSVVPVIGTAIGALIGGLIGGTAGGGLGGLIGPGKQNSYSDFGVDVTSSGASLGTQLYQKDANAGAELQSVQQGIASLNTLVANDNLSIHGSGFTVGDNTPGGYQDPSKLGSFGAGLAGLTFTSNGTDQASQIINQDLSNRSYTSTSDLQSDIDTITTFVNTTVPALKAFGTTTGSLNDQLANIHASFDNAITTAQNLGYAETDLTTARDKALQAANDAAAAALKATDDGYQSRYLSAAATISGNPADALTSDLFSFDTSAQQQRDQMKADLVSVYGDSITTTQTYADQIADLDRTLGEERLAITNDYNQKIIAANNALVVNDQGYEANYLSAAATISGSPADAETAALYAFDTQAQQQRDALTASMTSVYGDAVTSTQSYADQIAALDRSLGEQRLAITTQYANQITAATSAAEQTVTTNLASISAYALSLQTGSASALSPQAQYALAGTQFNTDAAGAQTGDATSLSQLTTYAGNYLSASRTVNGSGAAYTADYNKVLSVLGNVASLSPDTLTASVLKATTQTQTDTLVAALVSLQSTVSAGLQKIAQSNGAPSRIAA